MKFGKELHLPFLGVPVKFEVPGSLATLVIDTNVTGSHMTSVLETSIGLR